MRKIWKVLGVGVVAGVFLLKKQPAVAVRTVSMLPESLGRNLTVQALVEADAGKDLLSLPEQRDGELIDDYWKIINVDPGVGHVVLEPLHPGLSRTPWIPNFAQLAQGNPRLVRYDSAEYWEAVNHPRKGVV